MARNASSSHKTHPPVRLSPILSQFCSPHDSSLPETFHRPFSPAFSAKGQSWPFTHDCTSLSSRLRPPARNRRMPSWLRRGIWRSSPSVLLSYQNTAPACSTTSFLYLPLVTTSPVYDEQVSSPPPCRAKHASTSTLGVQCNKTGWRAGCGCHRIPPPGKSEGVTNNSRWRDNWLGWFFYLRCKRTHKHGYPALDKCVEAPPVSCLARFERKFGRWPDVSTPMITSTRVS